jgi:hypothetical protein
LGKLKGGKTPLKIEALKGLSRWDNTRITIVGSMSSLIAFTQMFFALSIIPNKDKQGWHDKSANASVIYINKYKNQLEIKNITLKPYKVSFKKYNYFNKKEKICQKTH